MDLYRCKDNPSKIKLQIQKLENENNMMSGIINENDR